MKKTEKQDIEMKSEYDFTNCKAVRGKKHKPLHLGYAAEIQQEDGATVVNHYKLIGSAVILPK
jgi:hypothetical protein